MHRFDLSRSFEGRTAFVTGGSSGIGKACVEAIADCGGNVALTYANGLDRAQELQKRIGSDRISIHKLDLADATSIENVVREVRERWPDWVKNGAMIHSAAVGSATVKNHVRAGASAVEKINAFYIINAIGSHQLADLTMSAMLEGEGNSMRHLVGISSVGSTFKIFPRFNSADGVSKAAVNDIFRGFAAQTVKDDRFRINVVCPGMTDTPMFQASTLNKMSPKQRVEFDAQVPKGRVAPPEEIADIVVFLCSDLAKSIHGATIDASSGLALDPSSIQ